MRLFPTLALALAACSGLPRAPMSDGQRMYLSKCSSCHTAYVPAKYSPQAWAASIDKMERLKKIHLSLDQRALILQYLTGDPMTSAR